MWSCESRSYYLLQAEDLYERCMPEKNIQIVLKGWLLESFITTLSRLIATPQDLITLRPVTLCCHTPPPLSISRASFYEQ